MKSKYEIIDKIDLQIEREIRKEKTLKNIKKSIRKRKLEILQNEITKIIELNELLELINYKMILQRLKPKDKIETKQIQLTNIPKQEKKVMEVKQGIQINEKRKKRKKKK